MQPISFIKFYLINFLRLCEKIYYTNSLGGGGKPNSSRVGNSLIGFLSELLVFCQKHEQMSDSLILSNVSELLRSLTKNERP